MHRWFAYLEAELERLIREDPFDSMVEMLDEGAPFAFSRFGDGEFNAIFGFEGSNCDGHPYHPELGARLRGILARKPTYLMGLQPLAVLYLGARHIYEISRGIDWVLADSLHLASEDGRLGRFFDGLAGHRVTLVGPARLGRLAESKDWSQCVIPDRNCWARYDFTLAQLKVTMAPSGDVVLFCASMMSNVLIDDLCTIWPNNTYIDAGSVLDPYAGVGTRGYHKEFGPEAERQIEAYGVRDVA